MYYIEFSLIRRDLYAMTQEQRTAHLEEVERQKLAEQKSGVNKYPECVFAPWQVMLFKALSKRTRYDPMNQIYRVFFVSDEERQMAANRFEQAYNAARLIPENIDFASKFQLSMGMHDNSFESISIDEDLIEEMQFEAEERQARLNAASMPRWEDEAAAQNIKTIEMTPVKRRQLPPPGQIQPVEPWPRPGDKPKERRPSVFVRVWRWIFGDPK